MNGSLGVIVVSVALFAAGCASDAPDSATESVAAPSLPSENTDPSTDWPTASTSAAQAPPTSALQRPIVSASPNDVQVETTVTTTLAPIVPAGNTSGAPAEIGWLQIPKVGLSARAWKSADDYDKGATDAALDSGPTFWGTPVLPGQEGNLVVGGHRVSKGAWFRNLDQLSPGDEIVAAGPDGVGYSYLVDEVVIVGPNDTWILNEREGATITLFACHPPGSVRQRIVVFGNLAT